MIRFELFGCLNPKRVREGVSSFPNDYKTINISHFHEDSRHSVLGSFNEMGMFSLLVLQLRQIM